MDLDHDAQKNETTADATSSVPEALESLIHTDGEEEVLEEHNSHADVSVEDAAWAAEQYEAYQQYLQEQAEEALATLQEASHTKPYLVFTSEVFTNTASLQLAHHAFQSRRQQLQQEYDRLNALPPANDDVRATFQHHDLRAARSALQDLDGAREFILRSQRQLYYANLVNTLENYVIDVCKAMLIQYPAEVHKKINEKLKRTFSYEDLLPHLGDPNQLADYLLNTLIEGAEREYTLEHALKLLLNWDHFMLPGEEMQALKRCAQVRHKITHRHGRVDAAFITTIKGAQSGGVSSPYVLVGNQSVNPGDTYRVSANELEQARALVESIATAVENTVVRHYPKLIAYDPWDWGHYMDDLERGIRDWLSFV